MEDDLKDFRKWKTTSCFLKNGRQHLVFFMEEDRSQNFKMEDDLYFENGRRPQFYKMEDDLNFIKWNTTSI